MRTPATRFEDLVVWQKAHQFVVEAYSRAILTSVSFIFYVISDLKFF